MIRLAVEVAVVGAGFAGLAAAMELRDAGHEVALFERSDRVGGTWRDNTYPGVACDVPSHLYGFARHPEPGWSATFAPGAEIQAYLERVAAREGLSVTFDAPLQGADWDSHSASWRLNFGGTAPAQVDADVLVLACGRLTEPRIPAIEGLEAFRGPIFHSARWNHDADLEDRHVAVVGSGASAVQLVPSLVRTASHLTLFQRSAPWIVPRGGRAYLEAEKARFAEYPEVLAVLRAQLHAEGEARFAARSGGPATADAAQQARAHLEAQVADLRLRELLTPDYAFGCKRVLLSDEFYPAFASGRVTLEPSALAAIDGDDLVAASGTRFSAIDAIVLATGFQTTRQPYARLVRGEDGVTLEEHWAKGMTSFASTVIAGFPNLFVLNGPNASLGHTSSVLILEAQAEYVADALGRRSNGGVLRVRPEAEREYTAMVDGRAADTPWLTGGCRSWYIDERSRRLTLVWPGTVADFRAMLSSARGTEFEPTASMTDVPALPAR
ncbi:NAD(P)/FAD-dependent oxidoreductase [Paenarthrobacter nitroguajacolicus]|uniref:flavin-containing monooxygenase n=1 Tax=Paenarthrobacter nitroguajacolicus TaxID=211146 RepID=UPI00285B00DC|nr:NAD(P)/FAD-dependent oxidoreductase [Paenarthrobacter nitroguajacolicus]MDR6637057.1 cation diffusion facilitator CzcD-associated flavoprotein CzcO [Paenarthrobacter nitroguajacolicus]